jgi:serine protease Do
MDLRLFRLFRGLIFCVCSLVLAASLQSVQAAEVPEELRQRQQQLLAAHEKARAAVVGVSDGMGVGSGVIVSADGFVLTASHVVEGGRRRFRRNGSGDPSVVILMPDGTQYRAEILGRNADADAALLRITEPPRGDNGFPHVKMGRTSETKAGQWCFAMGHPGGYRKDREAPLRVGRVLSVGSRTVVSDCAILLGDSGGPLFDLDGQVIGIHSMITSLIIENRHVAIDVFNSDWDRLLAGERWGELRSADNNLVATDFFGVVLQWQDFVPRVSEVRAAAPAEKAGIKPGDVLLGIGDGRIADRLDLGTTLALLESSQSVRVRVLRDGVETELPLTTGTKPASEDRQPGRRGSSESEEDDEQRQQEIMEQLSDNRRIGPNEKRDSHVLKLYESLSQDCREGVVAIRDNGPLLCLGTVITEDGYILTKASELNNALRPEIVFPKGGRAPVRELARDYSFDLALLKADGVTLKPAVFRDSPANVGELALIQDPRGRPSIPTVISVRAHEMENSRRAFLGIKPATAENGVRISEIIPGGAAERNGLKADDLILSVGGQDVQTADQLIVRVRDFQPGDRVGIQFMRGEKIQTMEIVLTPRFTNENPLLPLYDSLETRGQFASVHAGGFPRVLQIDADVYPSKVGGPLLDLDGKALGIVIARADRYPTYAIPADSIMEVYRRLRAEADAAAQSAPAAAP